MKLLMFYRKRWQLFYLPVILCAAAALWWTSSRWQVLPPGKAVIAAGAQEGSYSRLAQRYAEQLERIGMQVEIVYSDTEKGSLDRLGNPQDAASIGFAHGIYAPGVQGVQALAVVGHEPLWIFSSLNGPSTLAQSRGLRIAAGPPAGSSYMAAQRVLALAGVRASEVRFEALSDTAAAEALVDGKVDMVFQAASDDSQVVQLLTRMGGIQLLGVEHAGALAVQDRFLKPLLLPQGAIELRGDIPPRDLTLMSLQTHLLVRPDLHPALQRALLDAAQEIHEIPTFLQHQRQFPNLRSSDFPMTLTAKAYSLGDRPWVETLLPYGKAQLAQLLLYAVIPILVVALTVLAWIPKLFDWRVRAALNHFYGELKFLESEMEAIASSNPTALRSLLERLDHIEHRVVEMDLPDEYSERWYTLREHLSAAQERLLKLRVR